MHLGLVQHCEGTDSPPVPQAVKLGAGIIPPLLLLKSLLLLLLLVLLELQLMLLLSSLLLLPLLPRATFRVI